MVNLRGHKVVIEHSGLRTTSIYVDGLELKYVTAMSVRDSAPDELAEMTITFEPSEIIIKGKDDEK